MACALGRSILNGLDWGMSSESRIFYKYCPKIVYILGVPICHTYLQTLYRAFWSFVLWSSPFKEPAYLILQQVITFIIKVLHWLYWLWPQKSGLITVDYLLNFEVKIRKRSGARSFHFLMTIFHWLTIQMGPPWKGKLNTNFHKQYLWSPNSTVDSSRFAKYPYVVSSYTFQKDWRRKSPVTNLENSQPKMNVLIVTGWYSK